MHWIPIRSCPFHNWAEFWHHSAVESVGRPSKHCGLHCMDSDGVFWFRKRKDWQLNNWGEPKWISSTEPITYVLSTYPLPSYKVLVTKKWVLSSTCEQLDSGNAFLAERDNVVGSAIKTTLIVKSLHWNQTCVHSRLLFAMEISSCLCHKVYHWSECIKTHVPTPALKILITWHIMTSLLQKTSVV